MRSLALGRPGVALVLVGGCALYESRILCEERWSDLSDTDWTIGESESAAEWVEGGGHPILVKQGSMMLQRSSTEGPLDDAQNDGGILRVVGTNDPSGADLLVRLADSNHPCMFQIGAGGTYRDGKRVANTWTNPVAWAAWSSVRQGVAESHLTLIARGGSFTSLVNGTEVAGLTDASLSSGRVGVAVTAYSNDIDGQESFDNLTVRELE